LRVGCAASRTSGTVDVDAYLRRIGHAGPCRADRATLEALIAAHAAAIAFENVEVLAGRVPALDLASLQHKLLSGSRGGYCYEQNLLFLAMLRAIGFDAQAAEARVRAKVPAEVTTGRTHLTLRVALDDAVLLVDVGFGGMAPLGPVAFDGEPHRCDDGAVYRLVPHDDGSREIALQIRTSHGWDDCYRVDAGNAARRGPRDGQLVRRDVPALHARQQPARRARGRWRAADALQSPAHVSACRDRHARAARAFGEN
jgi:N-hydroxyarylamine O-acetyltransferase